MNDPYRLENGLMRLKHLGKKYLGWIRGGSFNSEYKHCVGFETLSGNRITSFDENVTNAKVPKGSLVVWDKEVK